ncbi:MAG: SRPBCC family protein [Jiangellaceae bacterium]
MPTFVNTVVIHRRVEDVFAFLADFENVPRWNYAIVETRKTSAGPVGVGSTYRQTRSVPNRTEETFVVARYEPGERLEIRGRLGPFPAVVSYVLESVAGSTRLQNSVELELRGPLRLAGPVVVARVKAAVAANLEVLKEMLEGDGR